jgi:undecaprenyl-diphosphatase
VEPRKGSVLPLGQAVWLGLAHGPTELLPVSSSGHVTLIAWLCGWSYAELDLELRKDFEVALHAGTAAALLLGAGREAIRRRADGGWLRELLGARTLRDRRAVVVLALGIGPPAVVGLLGGSRIERLGTPRRIAGGLAAGSLALAVADLRGGGERRAGDAGPLDGLLLGLAQAAALMPGISRNGATLTVGRARGFGRAAADELSRDCGLPVIVGAVGLRGLQWALAGRGRRAPGEGRRRAAAGEGPAPAGDEGRALAAGEGRRLAAGGAAAFVSTLAAGRVLARRERPVSLLWCAAYRTALAGVVVARLRRGS